MTFTIGRSSFGNDPSEIQQYGDRLSLGINILPDTLIEAKVLRQQVLGLVDNSDEPVVPLTWSADPDFDGFYRVMDAEVEPVQTYLSNRMMRVRLDLERVGGGYSTPPIEITELHGSRSTSTEAVTPNYNLWLPSTAIDPTPILSGYERSTDDGSSVGVAPGADGPTYRIAAGDFYDGACRVETYSGGSWYPVMGRQIAEPSAMRVNNGTVRLEFSSSGDLVFDVYDGTTWDEVDSFQIVQTLSSTGTDTANVIPTSWAVLRNGPETVTVVATVYVDDDTWMDGPQTGKIWFTLSRGERFVAVKYTTVDAGYNTDHLIGAGTAAGSSITGGKRETANGATGHRLILMNDAADGLSKSSTITALEEGNVSNSTTYYFGIGAEKDGSSSSGRDQASFVVAQYWGIIAQAQKVVSP